MSYQVPQHIDNNKIFVVNRSEIEGRLDPHYNKPFFSNLWHLLSHQEYELTKLKDNSIGLFSGITPKSGGDAYVPTGGVPFVRSGDFSDTNEIVFSRLLQIKEDVHQELMRGSQLKKGDLLIAIVGATIGKIGVYQYEIEANINQAICAVRLKDYLNPYYVQAFYQTSIGQKIIERIKRPVARANINIEEVGNLPIPLLDSSRQSEIVRLIEESRKLKKNKDTEAKQLLESIDTCLLNELGIILPESKTDLIDRVFFISYNNLTSKRLDPKKYSLQVQQLLDSINASRFETKALKTFVSDSCSGDWGIEESETIPEGYTRCLTLRATEIDNQYNLNVDYSKAKHRLIKDERLEKMNMSENDIIIEKSGGSDDQPVGRVAIIEKELLKTYNIAFSNFLMKIKVSGIDPNYLYCFLKTMYNIGVTDSMQSQTNGIRNLILDEFLSQPIVVPPLEKQIEIANHVYELRQQAKSLQEEGKCILELARQEVERMILQ